MTKISMNMAKVPSWLNVHKSLVPDFVVKDPKVCIGLLFLLLLVALRKGAFILASVCIGGQKLVLLQTRATMSADVGRCPMTLV